MMLRTVCATCKPKPKNPAQLTTKRFRSTNSLAKRSPSRTTRPHSRAWTPNATSSSSNKRPPAFHRRPSISGYRASLPHDSPFIEPSAHRVRGAPPEKLSESQCSDYFKREIKTWSTNNRTLQRFARFGYEETDIQPFLDVYASHAQTGFFSKPENFKKYQLIRFSLGSKSSKPHLRLAQAEITFSNIFFSWVLNTTDSKVLDELVAKKKASHSTLVALRHLAEAGRRQVSEEFHWARKLHRKFIMHVGPTNSGKTHHALRALAAAKTGVYAGPLRLLAHEIWERLNLGQIVPLGVEQPPPNVDGHLSLSPSSSPSSSSSSSSSSDTTIDPSIAHTAAKLNYNPTYARACNMITGEEKKIVSLTSSLTSSTVEMVSFNTQYDVGVIDEIQMIGDSQRGYAWTEAVLGLCAKEIHLCGEESAIPIIQELVQETGDELEIRRYQRLSPLSVEKKSLEGDFANVKKGDCVVAFSRGRIFEIKEEIERKSGLRCAVVYGKLPPEVRSEQAALFNDPYSGFDVIIGSDAIGMGLNLKIRRIIFDALAKSDGSGKLWPLNISQTKQIAGRAGRYGHSLSGEKPGGYVTTLHDSDLPALKSALEHPSTPTLQHAYITYSNQSFNDIVHALVSAPSSPSPSSPSTSTTLEIAQMAHIYTTLPHSPIYQYTHSNTLVEISHWIEEKARDVLTWDEKLLLLVCPAGWRDPMCVQAVEEMVKMQRDEMCVDLKRLISVFGLDKALEKVEGMINRVKEAEAEAEAAVHVEGAREGESADVTTTTVAKTGPPKPSHLKRSEIRPQQLEQLESFHKILVLYVWMHFRNTIVYPDREPCEQIKNRVEVALDWGLQEIGKGALAEEDEEIKKWISQRKGVKRLDAEDERGFEGVLNVVRAQQEGTMRGRSTYQSEEGS
ncbi:ATP-dependent RNA helicase SUV3, mitochondrial [Leucoagaricus sp. SymC.cos]|nr:ATP-dependent RNA helicase SUV3, mitochondrial [Leucoagaricus sp. SymC.cos]